MAVHKKAVETTEIKITPPNFKVFECTVSGEVFVSNKFSQESQGQMERDMESGEKAKNTRGKRPPKDFNKEYLGSLHSTEDGKYGIPSMAFKAALVRACSTCGVEMVKAKMCFFVLPDAFGTEGEPLCLFTKGTPKEFRAHVRNSNGSTDIRARGRFEPWECKVRVRYDADLFSAETVANLLSRAGISVGVGAGRPFSTMSCGQGWGTFEIK